MIVCIRVPAVTQQAIREPLRHRASSHTPQHTHTQSDQWNTNKKRHHQAPISLSLSLSVTRSLSPLEEATLISQALMRQNGTDLVRHCATRGGLVQGWQGGGLVCAICHPAPAWHGALRGGRDTDCLAGLEWKGGERGGGGWWNYWTCPPPAYNF